jgi:D-3-phosphoglycerate dehydrogenase
MKKILANDGIDAVGKKILQDSGFTVITDKVAQDNLADYINSNSIEVLTVRSATKVRKDIIDSCINLKLVVRGGVGIDNIDAEYAKEKGLKVANTPAASSDSVAELVIASMFSMCRFLYDSNRKMPISGALDFNELKKKYSGGKELKGKTLGIIGIGRIGQAVASRALGLGMKVVAHDPFVENTTIKIELDGVGLINIPIKKNAFNFEKKTPLLNLFFRFFSFPFYVLCLRFFGYLKFLTINYEFIYIIKPNN